MRLVVILEVGLNNEPCLPSGLQWLMDNLVELDGEGAQDPGQHDVVQPSPIGGHVNDVGEDVVVEGIAPEC
jgi:hypothetical protein